MRVYLVKMKLCADMLASIGNLILEEDQILYILVGLSIECKFVVVLTTSWLEPDSLSDVGALFLAHEN